MRTIIAWLGCIMLWLPSLGWAIFATPCQMTEPMSVEAIAKRTQPVGTLEIEQEAGMPAPSAVVTETLAADAGEKRYRSTCAVCHESGLAGAPKYRSAADWKPRMSAGIDGMLAIAIKGKGGMPPKGTCMQCSDAELKAAIEYMLPQ